MRYFAPLFDLEGNKLKLAAIKAVKMETGCNSTVAIELLRKHTVDGTLDIQGLNDELVPQEWIEFAKEIEAEEKKEKESIKPGWQMLVVNCRIDDNGNIAETKEFHVWDRWGLMPYA